MPTLNLQIEFGKFLIESTSDRGCFDCASVCMTQRESLTYFNWLKTKPSSNLLTKSRLKSKVNKEAIVRNPIASHLPATVYSSVSLKPRALPSNYTQGIQYSLHSVIHSLHFVKWILKINRNPQFKGIYSSAAKEASTFSSQRESREWSV